MKRISLERLIFAILTLFGITYPAYSQIVLSKGESYIYDFVNLPFSETVDVAGATPGCGLTVGSQTGEFQFEMFENSATETPFVLSESHGIPSFWYGSPDHWQDLQGAVRFTALSDSVVIDRFQVDAYVPRGSVSDIFSVTVVPEPSLCALSALAFTILMTSRKWIFRSSNAVMQISHPKGCSWSKLLATPRDFHPVLPKEPEQRVA